MSTTRAIIYARVSTDDEKQATSIPNQLERLRAYCLAHEFEVVAEISDEGITGTTMDRPGWNKVSAMLKANRADIVISTNLDRMTRDVLGFLEWVRDVLKPSKKDIASVHDNIDTSSAMGEAFMIIMLTFSQLVAAQTREKTAAAMHTMASNGKMIYTPPFGMKPGDVKGVPVKGKDWPHLLKIFELAGKGKADSQILEYCRNNGIKGPRGGEIGHSTIKRILSNRAYIGEIIHGGESFPAHPDIPRIDMELWENAQRQPLARKGRKPNRHPYLLSGKVFAPQWELTAPRKRKGEAVEYRPSSGTGKFGTLYTYYRRADTLTQYGGLSAKLVDNAGSKLPACVTATSLDQAVLDKLKLIEAPDNRDNLLGMVRKATVARTAELKESVIQGKRRLAALNARHDKILDSALLSGDKAVLDRAARLAAKLTSEIQGLEAQILGTEEAIKSMEKSEDEFKYLSKRLVNIDKLQKNGEWETLRGLVDAFVHHVDLRADEDGQLHADIHIAATPLSRSLFEGFVNTVKTAPTGELVLLLRRRRTVTA